MNFLAPYYLFAISGIAIPIAIHLWNRKSGKVIKVGSVKFLKESESSSFSNVRLTELVLLALRILLILLLSLIMAGTSYMSYNKNPEKVCLIDRTLLDDSNYLELTDSLRQFAFHFLEVGFPKIDDVQNPTITDYWQLMNDMEEEPDKEFVVYSANLLKNFRGKKRTIPQNVNWMYLPAKAHNFVTGAYLSEEDTLTVFTGYSDEFHLKINSHQFKYSDSPTSLLLDGNKVVVDKVAKQLIQNGDTIAINKKPVIKCQVIFDEEYEEDITYLNAVMNSINEHGKCKVDVEYVKGINVNGRSKEVDWQIWLTKELHTIEGRSITINEHVPGSGIVKSDKHDIYILTDRINPRHTNTDDLAKLPGSLLQLFLAGQYENQIAKHDVRVIDRAQLIQKSAVNNTLQSTLRIDLSNILWYAFFTVLIVERMLSFIRKQ